MQIRRSSFKGDRPPCSVDPHHPIHCHGGYLRYANCNDQQRQRIERFLCRYCGRTISVLPDDVLPYRAVSVPLIQQHFDAQAHRTESSRSVTTEKEKGCLKRAWARFQQHAISLQATLGQMIQAVKPTAAQVWDQLRRLGNLSQILLQLACPFNTSLLADYLCLQPWTS